MSQMKNSSLEADFGGRRLPFKLRNICTEIFDYDSTLAIEIIRARFVNESHYIDKYRSDANSFLYRLPSIPDSCGDKPQQAGTVPGGSR
jgi:hypothetical protein